MSLRAKVVKGGRIAIPSSFRKQLNIKEGEEVLIDVKDGNIVISSLKMTLAKVRSLVNKYASSEKSLVDELITMRREEAENE